MKLAPHLVEKGSPLGWLPGSEGGKPDKEIHLSGILQPVF
jgi:hypothetical protein